MNALPILLLGGAALMMMGGKKNGKKADIVERGTFESGEEWRIELLSRRTPLGNLDERYLVDVKLNGDWVTVRTEKYHADTKAWSTPRGYLSVGEAKDVVERLDSSELTIGQPPFLRGEKGNGAWEGRLLVSAK